MLHSKTCNNCRAPAQIACSDCRTRHALPQSRLSLSGRQLNVRTSHWRQVVRATAGEADDSALESARDSLSRLFQTPTISGQELRDLVYSKWGRSYDVRLHKRGRRIYLQIMWKCLEQRSFHLNELQYQEQLDAVAEYLTLWRVAETVRVGIRSAAPKGPGYTGGGGARAVSIPLDVDVEGGRSGEWDTF